MYFANQGPATIFVHFERIASRQYYRKVVLSLGEYNFFPACMDKKFHDKKIKVSEFGSCQKKYIVKFVGHGCIP